MEPLLSAPVPVIAVSTASSSSTTDTPPFVIDVAATVPDVTVPLIVMSPNPVVMEPLLSAPVAVRLDVTTDDASAVPDRSSALFTSKVRSGNVIVLSDVVGSAMAKMVWCSFTVLPSNVRACSPAMAPVTVTVSVSTSSPNVTLPDAATSPMRVEAPPIDKAPETLAEPADTELLPMSMLPKPDVIEPASKAPVPVIAVSTASSSSTTDTPPFVIDVAATVPDVTVPLIVMSPNPVAMEPLLSAPVPVIAVSTASSSSTPDTPPFVIDVAATVPDVTVPLIVMSPNPVAMEPLLSAPVAVRLD